MLQKYADAYEGLYDMANQDDRDLMEEELLADAYAGMNRFKEASVAQYQEDVRQTVSDRRSTQNAAATERTTGPTEQRFSVAETDDGRAVAVVDSDILSSIDTTNWNDTKKEQAKAAAKTALLAFKDGVQVNGIDYKVNKKSRDEYTRSNDTERTYRKNKSAFADKMRAAANVGDIITATTDWAKDGRLKHPRTDNIKDFLHGEILIQSGENRYEAKTVIGITDQNQYVFYDVVDMTPIDFEMKEEPSSAASGKNAVSAILEGPSKNNIADEEEEVKQRFSASEDAGKETDLTVSDVETLREIGKKNIQDFTSEDIQKSQGWAERYYKTIKEKSPFFRAWFGDWRENDTTPVKTVDIRKNSEIKAGNAVNSDTGWKMSWSSDLKRETINHLRASGIAADVLGDISGIIENSVYLNSRVSMPSGKTKMKNTAFMHHFYAAVNFDNSQYVLKLYVEEAMNNRGDEIFTRAYQLKDITKVADIPNGVLLNEGLTDGKSATINSVADLLKIVKKNDEEFRPGKSSVIVNEDGTPKKMYHGTMHGGFNTFGKKDYWYFADKKNYANVFAGYRENGTPSKILQEDIDNETGYYKPKVYEVYLNVKNPFVTDNAYVIEDALYWDRSLAQKLRDKGYDAIMLDDMSQVVVLNQNQIKAAEENRGTFDKGNSDIRFSASEVDGVAYMEAVKPCYSIRFESRCFSVYLLA